MYHDLEPRLVHSSAHLYRTLAIYVFVVSPVEIDGDHYLVERYESDVDDEGGVNEEGGADRDQVILNLSDKFLDEIDANGKVSRTL